MLIVYHELLPQAYLLGLAPDPAATSERALAQHLRHALQSGKAAVWVDCRLLTSLSPAAVRLPPPLAAAAGAAGAVPGIGGASPGLAPG
jgi:hypothetical protein